MELSRRVIIGSLSALPLTGAAAKAAAQYRDTRTMDNLLQRTVRPFRDALPCLHATEPPVGNRSAAPLVQASLSCRLMTRSVTTFLTRA